MSACVRHLAEARFHQQRVNLAARVTVQVAVLCISICLLAGVLAFAANCTGITRQSIVH